MKMLSRKALMCMIITLEVISSQKDSDEGRPYEFGFTIDGEQHRHEKKDQNGIIQGEFGFITADGVYHVTVYATDENGDFKILSMRNIRISAPLDGSPALGPISPEASKYLKKANLPNRTGPAEPSTPSLSPQKSERTQEASPGTVTQKAVASTQKPPYVFTTLSTIRPACAGCGLITTAKPGSKFTFQNPAFQQTTSEVNNPPVLPIVQKLQTPELQNRFSNLASDADLLPPRLDANIVPSSRQKSPQSSLSFNGQRQNLNTGIKSPVAINQAQQNQGYIANNAENGARQNFEGTAEQGLTGPAKTISTSNDFIYSDKKNKVLGGIGNIPVSRGSENDYNTPNGPQTLRKYQQSQFEIANTPGVNKFSNNVQVSDDMRNFAGDGTSYGQAGQNRNILNNNDNGLNSNTPLAAGQMNKELLQDKLPASPIRSDGPNPLLQPQEIRKLPPVVVTDNVIHVMGKTPIDIPIKDKYPGMMDGLPNGIAVKDVTNILYKFKYTVGFHGHYEKGLKDGSKIGGYFVNGRDGISRVVTYVADENGYRPKFKFINLGLDSPDTPNEKTEKTFGLKDFEFVWYPVE